MGGILIGFLPIKDTLLNLHCVSKEIRNLLDSYQVWKFLCDVHFHKEKTLIIDCRSNDLDVYYEVVRSNLKS